MYLSTKLDVLDFKYKDYPKIIFSGCKNHSGNLICVLNCV